MSADTYLPDEYETDDGYADDGEPPRRDARRRRVALVVAGVVAAAVVLTWVVAFSSLFGLRSVDVKGNRVLTSAQVEKAAQIRNGTPLVRVDTAAMKRRVERLPEVASAQVSTSFPSTVVISVRERTPVGYVRWQGRATLVDRTGLQYRTVAAAPADLPRFVLPSGSPARATAVAEARVGAAIPAALRSQVSSIEALDPGAITVVLTRGRIVRWGSAQRSGDKARVLPALLRNGDDHVDVTDPDRPFTH